MSVRLKKAAAVVGKWLIGSAIPTLIGFAIGYHGGHDAGRTEMKCAIMGVVENLGDGKPAPGAISLGCETHP